MGATDREVGMILNSLKNMREDILDIKDEFKKMDERQDAIIIEQTRIKTFAKGSWWLVGGLCTIVPAVFTIRAYLTTLGG